MSTSASFLLPDATQPAVVNDAPPRTPLVHVARQLLPPGRAFSQRADSVTGLLLEGMVEELQTAEDLVHSLALEPVTSTMLSTWTEALGIDLELDELAQRAAILRRLRGESEGNARADYERIAIALSLTIVDVLYWHPFEAGASAAGEPVRGDAWLHDVRIVVTGGDETDRSALQSIIDRDLRRAHTRVTVIAGV